MDDERRGWKQFHKMTFDRKRFSRRMKKAEGATVRHARRFIVTRLDNIRAVRRHIIQWLLLVAVMITAVGLQFLWFRDGYQTTAAAPGGTYAEASLGPIETLNPLFASSSAEITASRLIFSSLYMYDTTGHLKGDLASSMKVDDTGRIYTVTIHPAARWHDGTRLTAKDVAFTINLIKQPETRSPLRVNWSDISVKAIDDATLEFRLPAVYAAFPHALTFAVLPEHLLKGVAPAAIRENVFSRSPTGSGPFKFNLLQAAAGASQHKAVYLVANERYRQGAPLLARFEIHAYESQEAILRSLRVGEVSAASDIGGMDTSQIDKQNYTVINKPVNSGVYALLNTMGPTLQDKTVRQALQLATDTRAIRDNSVPDALPLSSPFINGQLGKTDLPPPPVHNAEKAGELLTNAGWLLEDGVRQKDGKQLKLAVVTTKNSQYEKVLETLAGQWRKIGIVVNTVVVNTSDPAAKFVESVLQPRNYDVLLYELFIGADPDVYAYWHSSQTVASGYNFSNYSNGIADDALSSARSRLEPELRNAKYAAFARQWADDVPAIGLYQSMSEYAVNKSIRSVESDATFVSSYDRFSNLVDWSVNQKSVYKTP